MTPFRATSLRTPSFVEHDDGEDVICHRVTDADLLAAMVSADEVVLFDLVPNASSDAAFELLELLGEHHVDGKTEVEAFAEEDLVEDLDGNEVFVPRPHPREQVVARLRSRVRDADGADLLLGHAKADLPGLGAAHVAIVALVPQAPARCVVRTNVADAVHETRIG